MPNRRREMLARILALSKRFRLLVGNFADTDAVLVDLADELDANARALKDLLDDDPRDADEVPGFIDLADRQAAIIAILRDCPASGFDGLLAKARAVRLRTFDVGYDDATSLGWALAGDVLRLLG